MFERLKAAWQGFHEARAQSRVKAKPSPLTAVEFFASQQCKIALSTIIRTAYADGVAAEKARVAQILQAPGAAHFLEIAVDLALGQATGEQAIQVLARAEADAATRAATIKSNMVESVNAPTRH
jgi:hypothetical protein